MRHQPPTAVNFKVLLKTRYKSCCSFFLIKRRMLCRVGLLRYLSRVSYPDVQLEVVPFQVSDASRSGHATAGPPRQSSPLNSKGEPLSLMTFKHNRKLRHLSGPRVLSNRIEKAQSASPEPGVNADPINSSLLVSRKVLAARGQPRIKVHLKSLCGGCSGTMPNADRQSHVG